MVLLQVSHLCKGFDGLQAVSDLSFTVEARQIAAIIGPNGAGKSTVCNLITGQWQPDSGSIELLGRNLVPYPIYRRRALGVARTFQSPTLFDEMTVLQNVMVGQHSTTKAGLLSAILRVPAGREEQEITQLAFKALERVGIESLAGLLTKGLSSLFDRRRVELARAIVCEPKLLILDELVAGLDAAQIQDIVSLIYKFRDEGMTILLIEHNVPLVMGISDEIMVLNFGRKIAAGSPEAISTNEDVIAAYLGKEASGEVGDYSASIEGVGASGH